MFEQCEDVMSINEMQEALGIGKATAYKLLRSKEIKAFRIGKLWKVPRQSIEAYIKAQCNLT